MNIYTTAQICGEIITVTNYCGEMNDTFFTIRSGGSSVVMEAEHIRALAAALDVCIAGLNAHWQEIIDQINRVSWRGTEAKAEALAATEIIKAQLAKLGAAT